jgi:pimeloyl-ACP methyl ester carboxylesterase
MSNSPGNPLDASHDGKAKHPSISKTVYCIAGIRTTVYGLEELPSSVSELACLWLLHPRLATDESMVPMAANAITNWNLVRGSSSKCLIAISFDQRNHGTRRIDPLANEAWRQGNPRHAQDMYSIYQGTAQDTSLLLTHLPSYLPRSVPTPSQHLVLGVSLGAHSAWHCILHDPRISAACIIIGCPDFARLMAHRASKSKLTDWSGSKPTGSTFFGSASFPAALVHEIETSDPACLLLPRTARAQQLAPLAKPDSTALDPQDRRSAVSTIDLLAGKAILNLAGGVDKLVPHACAEPFFAYLQSAKEGWWANGRRLWFDDRVFEGIGHAVSPEMGQAAVGFVADVLSGKIKVKNESGRWRSDSSRTVTKGQL